MLILMGMDLEMAKYCIPCTLPSDFVENSDDCNDDRMVINPLSDERCNNIDDDCDGKSMKRL